MNGLPAFTAVLAVPRNDILVYAIDRPRPWRWGREGAFCVEGSGLNYCWGDTTCTPDVGSSSSVGVCCRPGRINCRGSCRDPCSGQTVLNPQTCLCDPVCPPCPAFGQIQDPLTCQCRCPDPNQIPCHGICIDPLTDQSFCGGCPGTVCNPYDEMCCNGVCTKLGTKQNCGNCGDQVPAGWDCCDFTPTQLGTATDCRHCNDPCSGGRVCTAQGCQCSGGRLECPSGAGGICCPPTHKGCCGGVCKNLSSDTANCGSCGVKCLIGQSCAGGVCVCPSGQRPCGDRCWPNNQLCCQNVGCSASATDCCPGCEDFLSDRPGVPWLAGWKAAHPNTKFATCANGVFACHPSLTEFTRPQGGKACCPSGCTGIGANGLCVGCP